LAKKLGLKNPESVADHAYCVAAIAMVLSDSKKLDSEKILKMAILHDLAESITGDLTPEDGPKQKKEDAAMKKNPIYFESIDKKAILVTLESI